MSEYLCSAVVNDQYEETTVKAVSEKQAWYFFGKKFGFRMRDFRVVGHKPITQSSQKVEKAVKYEQLSFDI